VYLITANGESGNRTQSLDLELWALASLPPPVSWYPIHLDKETFSASEDAVQAEIAVTLGYTNTYADVSVAYATADGTATAGEDYVAVSGVVTIPAGSHSTTFGVPIIDDAVDEEGETVLISLSKPSGGTLARPSSGVLTIVDQDIAAATITPTAVYVSESGATDGYQVELATQPTDAVTVTATTDGQTTVAPAALIFTPLNWNRPQRVTVTAVDDDAIEGPRHLGIIAHQTTSDDPNYAALAAGEVTVYIVDNDRRLYLPLVTRDQAALAPDLVVDTIVATRDSVEVVIRNRGGVRVLDEFWVDCYIDPYTVPTAVNQNWPMVGDHGVVWGVTADALPALAPGGTITLTMGDAHYWPEYSSFPDSLAPGTPVHAQADSTDHATTYGAVLESHEIDGGPYNNISRATSTAALLEPTDAGSEGKRRRASRDGLPPWR
jgi:hypothetical protein